MKHLVALVLLAAAALADEGWVTHAIALSPDLKTVVRGRMHAERGTPRLLIENAQTGEIRFELKASGPIRGFAFRGDSARFVATDDHGPLRVIEVATGKTVGKLAGHRGWVRAVAFAGRHVVSAGRDDTLRAWDAERGEELWRKPDTRVAAVALSPDGARLAATDGSGRILLFDVATGKELRTRDTQDSGWMFALAFSRDGKRVAAGKRRIGVFDVESGKQLVALDLETKQRATALAFSADGSRLATADRERSVRVWRLGDGSVERAWSLKRGVGALVFSGDGRTLGAAKHYGKCHFWDLATGNEKSPQRKRAWTRLSTGSDALLLSVTFFDEYRGLAVGGTKEMAPSVILFTPDFGRSWFPCDVEAAGRLYDIDAPDKTNAFAVGFGGTILRTKDRGQTWKKLETPGPQWLAAVDFVSASTGYVVGGAEPPVIWKTTDGGDSWVSLAGNLPARAGRESLRDVLFLTEERGFVVGTGGLILETRDAGQSWSARDSGTDAWLRAISVRGKILHVAGKGVLLRSSDDGKTWAPLPIPEGRKLNDVAFVSADLGWITGFRGEVLETTDGGRSWNAVAVHTRMTGAIHVSPERVVVTGGGGTILRCRR
ncbi:MAG: YCF48-related protein [Planctomycetota bacterium]|jgi:photosystem II stability/assembly factor-like uncharacterized protein